jgi:hypothetical protein
MTADPSQTYVVRIYRCDVASRRQVVGVVENVDHSDRRAFTNVDELWQILAHDASSATATANP